MANAPIGVSFLPSQDQALEGGRRGQLEGVPEQAFKLLSLRLPRVLGARAISSPELLNAPGAQGPHPLAAVFEALLRASAGGGGGSRPGAPPPRIGPGVLPGAPPPPKVVPGVLAPSPGPPPYQPGANQTSRGGDPFYRDPTAPVTGQAVPRTGLLPGAPSGSVPAGFPRRRNPYGF